jgi:cytochrome c biogenesis protein CcdA
VIAPNEVALGIASALWLGLLTSISPCPLATNIAAISYLGRRVDSPGLALGGGVLYAVGRSAVYVALSALFVMGLLSIPRASRFLQQSMNQILGPVLVVTGIILLEWWRPALPGGSGAIERLGRRLRLNGAWGAAPLGALFALSFCPASAALFFGSLVPLAIRFDSPVVYPLVYGVGTSLPVVMFAFMIAFGARHVGRVFNRLTQVEIWARRLTGLAFIGVGLYMTVDYTLRSWVR